MKSKLFGLLLFFNSLFLGSAHGQWVQTAGPQGIGSILCMERVGSEIWMGYAKGIYRSSDEGASWNKSSLINNKVCCYIKSFGDSIFINYYSFDTATASYNYSLISSIDAGLTWSLPIPLYSSNSIVSVNILLRCANQLIACIDYEYYVSDDWGASWTLLTTPIFGNSNFGQGENNTLLMNVSSFGSVTPGVYMASNDLQTWEVIDTIHDNIQNILYKDSVFYLLLSNYDSIPGYNLLVTSSDFGLSWDTIHTFPYGYNYIYITVFDHKFYMQYNLNYIVSDDGGYTWTPITFPAGFYPSSGIPLSNGDQLVNLGNKVVRYLPDQNIYLRTETGLIAEYIKFLDSSDGVLYVGTTNKSLKSNDGGMTWSPFANSSKTLVDILFKGDTIISLHEGSIARSFNHGLTWDSIALNVSYTAIEEFNGRLYLSSLNSTPISYSDDYGITWSELIVNVANITGNCSTGNNNSHAYLLKVDTTLFLVDWDGLIAKLNIQSSTWEYSFCFWCTSANPNNKLYRLGNSIVMSGQQGLYVSNDMGNTWITPTCNGLPAANGASYPYYPVNLISINGIWFGSIGVFGVYYSNNQGNTWQQLQPGVQPFSSWGGLTLLNDVLYSGSYYSSVWRRTGTLEIISGNVYYDFNNNGQKDLNEHGIPNIIIECTPNTAYASTDSLGNFSLLTDAIGDSLKIILPTNYCSSSPTHYITNGAATNQNFGIQTISNIRDLTVDITNNNVFRPGFQTEIILTVKNNGSVPQAPEVKLILDEVEQYLSASPSPTLILGDTLIWQSSTLDFLETTSISVITKTAVTGILGDTVNCFAFVSPLLQDTIPSNNESVLSEIIVGSYDPNDKTCSFGSFITTDQTQNNEELNYTIRFQNTGNFQADFVHIKDTLSYYFDLSTFRIISSSHLMYFTLSGNGIIDFYFDNIILPPMSIDELGSQGYVKYGIRCKESVGLGNALVNTAYIYFDFNAPIITNTTSTLVTYPVVVLTELAENPLYENTILVYPNPAINEISIDLRGIEYENLNLMVFDFAGKKVLHERLSNTNLNKVDIRELPAGIYFGHVMNEQQIIGSFKFIVSK
ncbi:MAG TPA: T9SS type A sorting domain-containing protein [Bacteroidia bacterium]|nr:T9SS type A sorting domain-containing protein [Bacteroidia bacterium]